MEIQTMQTQIHELNQQLEHARQSQVGIEEQLSRARSDRDHLKKEVESLRRQIAAANSDAVAKAT
eukprot:CAMPEP_0117591388 /NCGR_PEP_ID=MMETSP0784-20121206/71506_1 /TAXON_ID=39447 /ORGANISM="" /LENGTH=64 /DNA_ID=CAMNT_0005393107 /DNA_START=1 /DNA_END=191 /DNA_ORIENTATION=+